MSSTFGMELTDNAGNQYFTSTNPGSVSLTGSNVINEQNYNGSTWDAKYNNTQGTLLASAARTTTTTSSSQTNYNAKGIIVFLDVTSASGTGGLTLRIVGTDPTSGQQITLNSAPTAITGTGLLAYVLYPNANGGNVTQSTSQPLPRTWQVNVYHGDATSYTYSVGYSLIN